MLSTYRQVFAIRGAWVFSLSGLVARLPISMVSLGIVVLVSGRTGSYAQAGAVSASFLVANAALAVPQARALDRLGQHVVLPVAATVFIGGMAAMMAAVEAGVPAPWPHLAAAVSGTGLPQIGSCVRARWTELVRDRALLQTAFAVEAIADESVFVIGPTLVTSLATVVHPLAGLTAALVACAIGTAALVAHRTSEPPARQTSARGTGTMPWPVLLPITVSSLGLGMLFGGAEVSTVAFADEAGAKAVAGVMLAVWAFGSLLSGVIAGAVRTTVPSPVRFRWGMLLLGLLMAPLAFVDGFWVLGAFLFLAGFAVSPTLIAGVGWVQEVVPAGRLTEGITLITTGVAAGIAPGAAVVGVVVDHAGASASYLVCSGAGLVAAALAFATAAIVRRRPSPT